MDRAHSGEAPIDKQSRDGPVQNNLNDLGSIIYILHLKITCKPVVGHAWLLLIRGMTDLLVTSLATYLSSKKIIIHGILSINAEFINH